MSSSCNDLAELALLAQAEPLIPGGISAHQAFIIIGAFCTLLTLLLIIFPVVAHWRNFTNSLQQRHLVRILLLPGIYTVVSLLGVSFYEASAYLEPIPKLYEAITICSLMELFMSYLGAGHEMHRADRIHYVESMDPTLSRRKKISRIKLAWTFIFLNPWIMLACIIATEISTARQCDSSNKARMTKIIIRAVSSASTVLAVITLLMFYRRMKKALTGHGAGRKLVAIKILLIVVIVETLLFGVIKPSSYHQRSHVSFFDLTKGVPNLLICIEMVLFGLLWLVLFSTSAVHSTARDVGSRLGFGRAVFDSLNIFDAFTGIFVGMKAMSGKPHHVDPSKAGLIQNGGSAI